MKRKLFTAIIFILAMSVSASAFSGSDLWQIKTDTPVTSGIAVSGSSIFFGTETGRFYSVNASTGRVVWDYKADNTIYGTPSIVNDTVIFAKADGEIICLKIADGSYVWSAGGIGGRDTKGHAVNDGLSNGTAAGGGLVYVSKYDRKVHAFSENDGRTAWTYTTGDQGVRSAPAYSDGLVFVGEYDGIFSIIDAKSGKRLNGGGAGGAVNTPTVSNGIVYFSAWDGSVNAVKIKGVEPLWHVNVKDTITTQPEVSSGRIVVGTGRGAVIALDEKTGRILWRYNTSSGNISAKPVIASGMVFTGAETGGLFALDLGTGRLIETFGEGGVISTPVFADGVLYFAIGSTVYAMR